jgi:hypothetical protein
MATLEPILCDFGRLTMSFWHYNHWGHWHGVARTKAPQLRACAMDVRRELLDLLFAKFKDVFVTTSGLPPHRSRDHHIHLLPNMVSVAIRSCHYPQL